MQQQEDFFLTDVKQECETMWAQCHSTWVGKNVIHFFFSEQSALITLRILLTEKNSSVSFRLIFDCILQNAKLTNFQIIILIF